MKRSSVLVLGLALLGCLGCQSREAQDPVQSAAGEQGIEVLGVQLMADGDVARLNYRVVDYEKAKRSLQGEVRLLLEGPERPLGILSAGRLGPLRQRPARAGRPQFMIFMNPGRNLRKGDRVILAIGDARIPGILVS